MHYLSFRSSIHVILVTYCFAPLIRSRDRFAPLHGRLHSYQRIIERDHAERYIHENIEQSRSNKQTQCTRNRIENRLQTTRTSSSIPVGSRSPLLAHEDIHARPRRLAYPPVPSLEDIPKLQNNAAGFKWTRRCQSLDKSRNALDDGVCRRQVSQRSE